MSGADEEPSVGPSAGEAANPPRRAVPEEAGGSSPAGRVSLEDSPPWHRATKTAVGVAFGLGVVGALYLARNALTLVALSGLLAFLVAPLIRFLQRRARFPKALALLTSYVFVLIAVLTLGALIVAGIASSFAQVDPEEAGESLRATAIDGLNAVRTIEVGDYTLDLADVVDPTIERLSRVGDEAAEGEELPGGEDPAAGEERADSGEDPADAVEGEEPADAADPAEPAEERTGTTFAVAGEQVDVLLGGLLSGAQVVGGVLTAMLVTFLIAVYLSADSHRFHAGILSQVPAAYADDARRVNDRIGRVWRGYLYGQLINSLATGLLLWLVLWAVGLPGAFVLGLIMVLLNMIPTFGPILAAVPGVLTAIALGSTRLDWTTVSFTLLIIGIYVVVVQLQANLMGPFITGQAVSMAPATILIGLIVGFQVGGLVGSLLVVPVLATIKEVARYVLAKLLDRDPFAEQRDEELGSTASDQADAEPGQRVEPEAH